MTVAARILYDACHTGFLAPCIECVFGVLWDKLTVRKAAHLLSWQLARSEGDIAGGFDYPNLDACTTASLSNT